MSRLAALTSLVLAVSMSGACGSSNNGSPTDAAVPLADSGVSPPDSDVGQELTFVLAAMNGATVASADVSAHFAPDFVSAVGAAGVIATFTQLAAEKPWTLVGYDGTVTDTSLTAIVVRGDGQYWRVAVSLTGSPSLIEHLLVNPAGDLDPALQNFAAIDQAMAAVVPTVSELAATIDASGCTPIHALAADQTSPLGSQFKLYILATLAQAITAGTHAWTDEITIQDQYKSLPGGTFQNEPDGTQLTALQFADNMISISDNTAADHLLWFLGRDQVEAMLTTSHHHDPTEDQPFLTTRELFALKLLETEPERQTYIADSISDKRAALTTIDATLDPRTFTGSWVDPIDIDGIEWFASATDVCNVMSALKTYGDAPATANVYDVLAINPGIADGAGLFSYVGFKGGDEPGVLTLGWLLQRKADGAYRFYEVQFSDPQNPVNEDRLTYLAGAGRALLGK